jgi:serine phosphatase RsbU (regulator of sigma subunit)
VSQTTEWLASRLERIQRISTELASAQTAAEAVTIVLDLLDPPGISATRGVWLFRPETRMLEMAAQVGMPPEALIGFEHIPVEAEVPVAAAHRQRRTIRETSLAQSEQDFAGLKGAARVSTGFVAVPLVLEGVSLGAISLGYDDPPDDGEVLFLEAIAGQAAQTLMRLRLAERDRRRHAELEFLAALADSALDASDHRELMTNVTAAAVPTLGDWCAIHYLPEDGGEPVVVVAHVDPAKVAWAEELQARRPYDSEGLMGVPAVIRSGATELLSVRDPSVLDAAIAQSPIDDVEARTILASLQLTSVITVPLRTKQRLVGAMQFVSAESGREYDADDVALAEVVADRLAEPLEGAWVNDQHREFAEVLQRSLLPPRLPTVPGIDFAARYLPAGPSAVGGDFYDVFRIAPDSWALLIGDCCGTGPNAAALSSIARHTVRAAARHGLSHREVIDWLNQAVNLSDRDLFCTACYATLTRNGPIWELEVVTAGHPLPIVARAGATTSIGRPGTLLGVFDEAPVHVERTQLERGDVAVFYTDGVTDLPPPYGLTVEALTHQVRGLRAAGGADTIADRIEQSLVERVSDPFRADDVALVVLRVEGPAVPSSD